MRTPVVRTRRLPMVVPQTDGWRGLQEIRLTVPGPPVPKGRPRWAPNGHTYTPPRTVEAERRIADYFKATYPFTGPGVGILGIEVVCYVKGGRIADVDNYLKLVMDALNTRAFYDDKQIRHAAVTLREVVTDPRTEITIYRIVPPQDAA